MSSRARLSSIVEKYDPSEHAFEFSFFSGDMRVLLLCHPHDGGFLCYRVEWMGEQVNTSILYLQRFEDVAARLPLLLRRVRVFKGDRPVAWFYNVRTRRW